MSEGQPEACPECGYSEKHHATCPHNPANEPPIETHSLDVETIEQAGEAQIQLIHPDGDGTRVHLPRPQGSPGPDLVHAICEVRDHIGTVKRTGENAHYDRKHATHDDVTGALGPALAQVGSVWVFETVIEAWTRPVEITTWSKTQSSYVDKKRILEHMILQVTITDGDTDWVSYWAGTNIAQPLNDKSDYQLYSQILKFAYSKLFKIETGDPDQDDPAGSKGSTHSSSSGTGDEKQRYVFVPDTVPEDPSTIEADSPWTWDAEEAWFWAFLSDREAKREKTAREPYGVIGQADKGAPSQEAPDADA